VRIRLNFDRGLRRPRTTQMNLNMQTNRRHFPFLSLSIYKSPIIVHSSKRKQVLKKVDCLDSRMARINLSEANITYIFMRSCNYQSLIVNLDTLLPQWSDNWCLVLFEAHLSVFIFIGDAHLYYIQDIPNFSRPPQMQWSHFCPMPYTSSSVDMAPTSLSSSLVYVYRTFWIVYAPRLASPAHVLCTPLSYFRMISND
jgi:hypothetical protein